MKQQDAIAVAGAMLDEHLLRKRLRNEMARHVRAAQVAGTAPEHLPPRRVLLETAEQWEDAYRDLRQVMQRLGLAEPGL